MKRDRNLAVATLERLGIPADSDFHELRSEQVQALIREADRVWYQTRYPRTGSRARYFHALLVRNARRAAAQ